VVWVLLVCLLVVVIVCYSFTKWTMEGAGQQKTPAPSLTFGEGTRV